MMAARPVRLLLVLLLITITLTLIVKPGTSSARAAMGSGTAARTPRIATATPGNVAYHGGSVMTGTMNVYAIFREPAGWVVDPNYNGLIMQYYNDVGGSSLYKLMEQYTDANGGAPTGAVLAGTWVDPDDYPGSGNPRPAPTQQQILKEIQTAMQINGWQAGPSNYFVVYTAEGVVDTNECGYHNGVSNTLIFGYIPYPAGNCLGLLPTSPNNCKACDIAISVSAHEQFEAVTDPFHYTSPGWYYQTGTGEIADLCTSPYASPTNVGTLLYDNGNANQSWNGHFYLIQEMWDNGVHGGQGGCSQGSQITEYPVLTFNSGPWAITAGPDSNLWFTEHYTNQIGMITTGGQVTEYLAPNQSGVDYGITAGPDGNLWFTAVTATGGAAIGTITTGGQITEYPVAAQQGTTSEITAGPDGNLWFTEPNTNKIGSITTSGQITEYPVPPLGGAPNEITMGPDGNLWFTTVGGQIGKITTNGQMTEYPVPTANSRPFGITAGPDGNLWFTESNVNQSGRITPDGAITECPIPTSSSGPLDITVGPDGNLWFTELGGNTIGKITP